MHHSPCITHQATWIMIPVGQTLINHFKAPHTSPGKNSVRKLCRRMIPTESWSKRSFMKDTLGK